MSNILSIDTTLGTCTVALPNGIRRELSERNQQTSQLPIMVEEIMKEAGLQYNQLDGYAVTTGPGGFTGVRMGLAFIRGLALAVPKPIYAVTTLELLAYQAIESGADTTLTCAINAHREMVYLQHFNSIDGMPKAVSEAEEVSVKALPIGNFTLVGDAGQFFSQHEAITEKPDALALAHYAMKLPLPSLDFKPTPFYIRPPDAKAQKGDLTQCSQ